MTPEALEAIAAMCLSHNLRGIPVLCDDPDEAPDREEDVGELSDLDYHGQFERFTPDV